MASYVRWNRYLTNVPNMAGNALEKSTAVATVPVIGFVAGFGWAGFGTTVAATMKSIDNFSYVISAVITPLFLVAGTFFPLDQLPDWAQNLAQLNPLYHTVELVRHAAFGWQPAADVAHFGVLIGFALLMWRVAVWRMSKRLID